MIFFAIPTISSAPPAKITKRWSKLAEFTRTLPSPMPSSTSVTFSTAGWTRSTDLPQAIAPPRVSGLALYYFALAGYTRITRDETMRRLSKGPANSVTIDDVPIQEDQKTFAKNLRAKKALDVAA
jgi:hypothetical protein